MTAVYDLPEPNPAEKKRSQMLSERIRQEIDTHGGQISFASFMEDALYFPELGYYAADTFDLGSRGDFTTAPEISPLFAQCFARQIVQVNEHLSNNNILELGAGSGRFAKDLLLALEKTQHLPEHYYIYEISASLRLKQRALLEKHCPTLLTRIHWLDELPLAFQGIIVANEVLDALPFQRFRLTNQGIQEGCVSWDGEQFIWQYCTPTQPLLAAAETICAEYHLPAEYESEINLATTAYVARLATLLTCGVILLTDYGYGQREYYHPQRQQGTLTCFYQHHKHANPLILPGLQDITAHVDFTRVIESAAENGCELAGYTTQAAFLFACGLITMATELEQQLTAVAEFELHQAIKVLTMPTEMGERIKVMALSKNIDLPLLGFQLQDRRRDL